MAGTVIYGTRAGPFCIAARKLLKERGIEFEDVALDENSALRNDIRSQSKRDTVPQIWIGDRHVGGYSDLRALDMRGELETLANPS
jgi:glutaredoxin 3